MSLFICFRVQMIGTKFLKLHSTFTNNAGEVFILSAVRTPIGLPKGSLVSLTPSRITAVVLRHSLERANVPIEDSESVFLGCSLNYKNVPTRILQILDMKNPKISVSQTSGLNILIEAINYLLKNKKNICAVIGFECMSFQTNIFKDKINEIWEKNTFSKETILKYNTRCYQNLLSAYSSKAFEDEAMIMVLRKGGKKEEVEFDEVYDVIKQSRSGMEQNKNRNVAVPGDGAVAIVIASGEYVKSNRLTPLAKVISSTQTRSSSENVLSMQTKVIKECLKNANCAVEDISQWEINDFSSNIGLHCIKTLNIDRSLVNKEGGTICLGNPISMSGARMVCHLAHTLQYENLGCASDIHINGTVSAMIIQKLNSTLNRRKPHLLMYTKYSCPLCMTLKDQLELFSGRFDFEQVSIEAIENKKFWKLYRYQIPVIFLDGIFVCKHRLNYDYFKRRLERAEKLRRMTF